MESETCGRDVAERNGMIDERRNATAMKIATANLPILGLIREEAIKRAPNQRITDVASNVAFHNGGRCKRQYRLGKNVAAPIGGNA